MKYLDALDKVEQWLEKTGVRNYCRTTCKGNCCINYCKNIRCVRPPLSCAVFLCTDVKKHMMDLHISEEYQKNYTEILKSLIDTKIHTPNPMEIFLDTDIPDELITNITKLDVKFDKNKTVSDHGWKRN